MGGYGSGYQGQKHTTVENCREFDVWALRRNGFLGPGVYQTGTLTWRNNVGDVTGTIGWNLQTDEQDGTIWLHYTLGETSPISDTFDLHTTPQPFGGVKWWASCPGCNRRVRKLYLPSGGRVFRCRTCYRLTYESVQSHDARIDALTRNPEALLRKLTGRDPSLLALRAALKTL